MCAQVLEFAKTQTRRTMDQAVDIFLLDRKSTGRGIADDTERTYRERLGTFRTWAENRGLQFIDEVDADAIDNFFIHLRDERKTRTNKPLSDNTVRDYFLTLRAFFSALHRRGTISCSPISHKAARDFPEPEIERYTPTDLDMRRVLALFDGGRLYAGSDFGERKASFLRARNRAIFALMIDCGLRSFEIRNLERSASTGTTARSRSSPRAAGEDARPSGLTRCPLARPRGKLCWPTVCKGRSGVR